MEDACDGMAKEWTGRKQRQLVAGKGTFPDAAAWGAAGGEAQGRPQDSARSAPPRSRRAAAAAGAVLKACCAREPADRAGRRSRRADAHSGTSRPGQRPAPRGSAAGLAGRHEGCVKAVAARIQMH
jgi:hypothetical protein